jgi:DNA repair exonuclease SbcCD ATPase subunit
MKTELLLYRKTFVAVALVFSAIFLTGCKDVNITAPNTPPPKDAEERQEKEAEYNTRFNDLKGKTTTLQAEADDLTGEIPQDLQDAVKTLKEKMNAAQAAWNKFKSSAADKLNELEDELEDALDEWEDAYEDAQDALDEAKEDAENS